jgi:hypothetical protein
VRLREVQERFFRLLLAPEGVERGLVSLGLAAGDLDAILASDARRSAVERLDIYANMYFWRILDAMADMYPRVWRVQGRARFHNLVTDYLLKYPSTHPSLRNVGAALPRFLAERPDPDRPWLADLAALEWARHDVFDLADAEPLTMETLRALPPEAFAALPLSLVPAARLLHFSWSVDETWEAATEDLEGGPLAPPAPGDRAVLVWRQGLEVQHRALEPREAHALAMVAPGTRFGLVCDWLAGELPEDAAAQAGFGLLAQWATDGVLQPAT